MRYKILGRSGLRAAELCLGTMTFGEEWGWGSSRDESKKVFDSYVNAGGNFIDTANRYTEGTSEKYVGDFISKDRESFVLATKFTLFTKKGDPNASGNHRKNMVQSVNASLKRLKTDYIDLYWVHAWDFTTPENEVMRALDDLVRSGKILHIGISDTPAWIVSRSNAIADLKGWTQFTALQIEYSLIQRTPERDLLPMANSLGLAVTPWAVLGSGMLSGKYNRKDLKNKGKSRLDPATTKRLTERNMLIAEEVIRISKEIGCSPSQTAINWVRQQKGKMIPILGARTEKQIHDNLSSLEYELTKEHLNSLDNVSEIELGFPHDFLNSDIIKDIIYGGTQSLIDM
ncbi:aldo/keto reductase [candidate division KSB1 bacterium]